jgi:predicted nucleic acid-binding protein
MYLIDTNILSDARRGNNPASSWIKAADPDACFFSVVSLGEIIRGIAIKQRTDATAAQGLSRWLDRLRLDYSSRVLPITEAVALEWGRLTAIRSRPTADAFIAATAIVHRLSLVTRNVMDFADIDVPVINPFVA